jgi:site-specific DNA-methyltransferase (adenine-specific)
MRILAEADLPPGGATLTLQDDLVVEGENGAVLARLPDRAFDLIYIDPPFNTGRPQRRRRLEVTRDGDGDRTGFGGRRYRSRLLSALSYEDEFASYLEFLAPRLERARQLLAGHGSLYFHIDYREAHYCKLLLDEIFGRDCFLNELIWAYDYGAKPRNRWPAKHDTILVYVRDRAQYHFDATEVEREPYMAPGLVGAEKAARGKLPTDVIWHTIVPTTGREKTGYPSQKPEGLVRRFVAASSRSGGWCLDFFAGSGTLGAVCRALDRRFVLVDSNPQAIAVMTARLQNHSGPTRATCRDHAATAFTAAAPLGEAAAWERAPSRPHAARPVPPPIEGAP